MTPAPAQAEAPRAVPAAAAPSRAQPASPPLAPVGRKLIRNGSLSLEVRSIEEALATIKKLVEAEGGYVGNESVTEREYGARSASIACRVPAERLDAVLLKLRGLGKLEGLNLSAEDITEQYFNLEIRIANQKQLEARLLELLRRQSNQLKDLLEIEREYARVRGEIDELEGRKRFWDRQVALSTLVVNLAEPRPIAGAGGGVLRTLLSSFEEAGDNFVSTISGIIALVGAVLPIAALAWLAFYLWRRRRRRQAAS